MYCFLNGEIVPVAEAKISPFDIGFLRGFGVYEGIASFSGKIFHMADHWERFVRSAQALNLNIPITEDRAEKVIKELLQKNGHTERANIRFVLTGGPAIGGIEYNFENPTFCILTEPHEAFPKEVYEEGAKLLTYTFKREMPEIKSINYMNAVNLQSWRKEEGAIEILYVSDGEVLECATSNIFLVKDGRVSTPLDNILKGITRKVVLEIAGEKVEERPVLESELGAADEIFITSSFKDIVPIVKIDDFVIGSGKPGPITQDLMKKFSDLTQ